MSTAYVKAVDDLITNQGAQICGVLLILPDNRRATVDDDGVVHMWEAGEDGRLRMSKKKPFEEVVK